MAGSSGAGKSLYEHAGGREALLRFIDVFYARVLGDPLLRPLFGEGQAGHVEHLTDFEVESFGGPAVFSKELGFAHLIDVHRGLRITDAQRERFVVLYLEAADAAGLPSDAAFRDSLRSHVEFGALVAQQNSHARSEHELHPLREVPQWTWPGGTTRP